MQRESRIPEFYKLSVRERRQALCRRAGLEVDELTRDFEGGGLDASAADKIVENVVGVYGLPFGVALNFRVNGVDRLVPMVVEEPSVIAAASYAARLVRARGGFVGAVAESLITAQVQLYRVGNPLEATQRLLSARSELLRLAGAAVPNLLARGGGPRDIDVRDLGEGYMVVHIHIDCGDAMGANLANTIAEALGPRVAELARGTLGLRILTNLCDRRRVRVECRVGAAELEPAPERATGGGAYTPDEIMDGIVQASHFAERDPYRAATHNKGVMNGIDSVAIATGNDYRAVEAGAHAYAARSGSYRPLSVWRRDGGDLVGEIELPLALGIVGGTLRVHPVARLALKIAGATSANDLALLAASVGLASNLAALRALATDGIQRGHMQLHARSVAWAAGAVQEEVEAVARVIASGRTVTVDHARRVLGELRSSSRANDVGPLL
jgi:hydroxymethylglutaryl-CoA reductase